MKTPTQAKTLKEIGGALSPAPLVTPEEFAVFYREVPASLRSTNVVAKMKLGLEDAYGQTDNRGEPIRYKVFLAGHSGVGKSTEISRLINSVGDRFNAIRFDLRDDLDAINFKPFDVLLLMMIRLVEQTAEPVEKGGAGSRPDDRLLTRILDWFAAETVTQTQGSAVAVSGEAGAGPGAETVWAKIVGLFARVKGEVKLTANRQTQVVEYRFNRLDTLIDLMNDLLDDCHAKLRAAPGEREWLFIGESFDKQGVPVKQTYDLFVTYGNIFSRIKAHLIFDVPLGLVFSGEAPRLAIPCLVIPDTPVFGSAPDHASHREGRRVITEIVKARVSSDLFRGNQLTRLIIATGGNLRDLFAVIRDAAIRARLRSDTADSKIEADDVTHAIVELFNDYVGRVGMGPFDPLQIPFEQKAKKLLAIYGKEPESEIRDPVLNALLLARVVQEFDGPQGRWFGVHPLIVDLLADQGKIKRPQRGGVPGGTR